MFNQRAVLIYSNAYFDKYNWRLNKYFRQIHISDYKTAREVRNGISYMMGPCMRKFAPYSKDWAMAEMKIQVNLKSVVQLCNMFVDFRWR